MPLRDTICPPVSAASPKRAEASRASGSPLATRHSPLMKRNDMHLTELTDEEFKRFCGLIYRVAGIRLADNKRVLVSNRVRRRLRATGIESFGEYYTFVTSPGGVAEMPSFLDAITTNETYFYRDKQHYQWLGGALPPARSPHAAPARRA